MREVIYNEAKAAGAATAKIFHDYLSKYDYDIIEAIENDVLDLNEALHSFLTFLNQSKNKLIPAMVEVIRIYDYLDDEINRSKWEEILYEESCKVILDKNGDFPDILEWGWLENRPLIRSMIRKADDLWLVGDIKSAQAIYEGVLKGNAGDNPGVRYNLLGILEGMSFAEFSAFAYNGDYMSKAIDPWFSENAQKYENFKAMFKAWKQMGL